MARYIGFGIKYVCPLVLGFIFRVVLPLGIPNYTLFLFAGLLVWNWFQSSLFAATGAEPRANPPSRPALFTPRP